MALDRENLDPALQLYTTKEAAEILKMTPRRIRGLIREGKLPAARPDRTWLISKADLLECLERGRNGARKPYALEAAGKAPQEAEADDLAGDTAGAEQAGEAPTAAETAEETATD